MATAAPNQTLPLFYNSIEPLNVDPAWQDEGRGRSKSRRHRHTPTRSRVTVDEFALVQRHYPIVFSVGDTPVPIALMGLNEGVNVFLDANGRTIGSERLHSGLSSAAIRSCSRASTRTATNCRCASIRRRARSATSRTGEALFDGDQPSEATKAILDSASSSRPPASAPSAFVEELKKSGLLMDGEVAIQPEGFEQPFVYRGFQMVDEEKLREPARRRAAQDEPERHAAADLRAPLLAGADARRVRAPDAAGQGAGAGRRSRRPPTPEPALFGGRRVRLPSRARPARRQGLDEHARRSKPGPGSRSARRGRSCGRSRAAARGHCAPDAMPLDDVAAGERLVEADLEAAVARRLAALRC